MTMSVKPAAAEVDLLPSMNVAGVNTFLGDAFFAEDAGRTITCGLFSLQRREGEG